ncbi:DUF952 domain-containing protein [Ferrimonas balearica]|uniref:DUF952 domain-containing protein n=1 Tax=Ferrimonas balearica TaxID=44012 RepID=UPI001C99E387|nr:DUF952 domain-containing protein [Ferrimonas balearica]MBY5990575.1 DUF952 domain-containing protein [Ferrimonas balearica]
MTVLYRVLGRDDWEQAQLLGRVPLCGSDQRAGWVHLNCPEDVTLVTGRYFLPEEQPLALELDLAGLEGKLEWLAPTREKNWQQPVLKVAAIEVAWVRAVHELTPRRQGESIQYRLGVAEPV